MIQNSLDKKQDPISKISREKRAAGMAQATEGLPSKCKALSSNLSTRKKKKQITNIECLLNVSVVTLQTLNYLGFTTTVCNRGFSI
jgi:hypothetical protein